MSLSYKIPSDNWVEVHQEVPEDVKSSGMARHANRFYTADLKFQIDKENAGAYYEEYYKVLPYGPAIDTGKSSGAAVFIKQDGLQYCRGLHGEDEIVARVIPNYYSRWEPFKGLEDHDICQYCGEDNGLHGEYRNGWDCCYCGGN